MRRDAWAAVLVHLLSGAAGDAAAAAAAACTPGLTVYRGGAELSGNVVGTVTACRAIGGAEYRYAVSEPGFPPGCYRYTGPYASAAGVYFNSDLAGRLKFASEYVEFETLPCQPAAPGGNASNGTNTTTTAGKGGGGGGGGGGGSGGDTAAAAAAAARYTLGATLAVVASGWLACALLAFAYARTMRQHRARDPPGPPGPPGRRQCRKKKQQRRRRRRDDGDDDDDDGLGIQLGLASGWRGGGVKEEEEEQQEEVGAAAAAGEGGADDTLDDTPACDDADADDAEDVRRFFGNYAAARAGWKARRLRAVANAGLALYGAALLAVLAENAVFEHARRLGRLMTASESWYTETAPLLSTALDMLGGALLFGSGLGMDALLTRRVLSVYFAAKLAIVAMLSTYANEVGVLRYARLG